MTRKRFCKKLMALGASRNEAANLASELEPGQSFKEEYIYASIVLAFVGVGVSAKRAARAVEHLTMTFQMSVEGG